ncbi:MAG: deoxyribose-phosphate aldolase [Deinococcus sp.]|nr:deoxyribose-phosphate aldolase [Deinococcus sp.]
MAHAEQLSVAQVAALIDHTLLKPVATPGDIKQLCQEARQHAFATVCVNSSYVPLARQELAGSGVGVCTVVGFPLGVCATHAKVAEATWAVAQGAQEVDMVVHLGLAKAGDWKGVAADIAGVRRSIGKALLKVIIEICYLSDEEKVQACRAAARAEADFVKTSTGFAIAGATVADVALMRQTVGKKLGVKAAGGVSSWQEAIAMIQAGATRLGTSRGVQILAGRPGGAPAQKPGKGSY